MPSLDMPVFSAANDAAGMNAKAAAASATDRRRLTTKDMHPLIVPGITF
ncbi:hypothetical protein X748_28615 [Mesorhizobium sp. LNJC386A00]|nr:hypothetical protein X752_26995 [Mesorhizobium sp. LNJC398B00]ESY28772.1 hypothetical protein X748_28615 [Mesorhizobium sp. LNJC386A00]